jgi:hypothetical protein
MIILAMCGHFLCVLNQMPLPHFVPSINTPLLSSIYPSKAYNAIMAMNLITTLCVPLPPIKELCYISPAPHTSAQHGKAEHSIHTINDIMHTLLFQSHLKPCYWVDAMNNAVYLYNIRPSQPL